jgi:hypothetical protein
VQGMVDACSALQASSEHRLPHPDLASRGTPSRGRPAGL